MNRRQHARLARQLIEACGGLVEASGACRVGKSQLGECQNPHGDSYLPADVIFDLEAYCGKPIYSRALFEARPEVVQAKNLIDEACGAAEAAMKLQATVRLAASDGDLTPNEIETIARVHREAEEEVRDVGHLINRHTG
ncbi:hypothetical protein [Phenylobacterium sp. 58.2.17]|uniref:hypothetical protein n=1 Tax=Phenylobacterium sp. 58.2.17 TaxID=2969306 RepID=UPI002264FB41|nr:hypothetical protein [Phenylobacterium sp. 58.2.17]MCX7585041.1 hypothetical protein [Phenylobacterium sp. 58.2.17]